jgi:glutathione S-transferase
VKATLYVVPASHPSMAGRLMLERKGIDYRRVDLMPGLHKPLLRLLRFSDTTVPALKLDGRRLQSTLRISRELDELQPDPPLFPRDQPLRSKVEEAERWGEETLQPVPRRLSWWAVRRDKSRDSLRTLGEGSRLPIPMWLAVPTAGPIIWAEVKINGASDDAAERDLAELPGMLDHVDALLAEGVLGGDEPNAADYQIAPSVRLLLCFDDLREAMEKRPCAAYARAIVTDWPGHIPPVIPEPLLAGFR